MINIIVPVMRRPHNAEPFMRTLVGSCASDLVHVLAVAGSGDSDTAEAWAVAGAHVAVCHRDPGSFSQKINHGYAITGFTDPRPWLFLVGDDVIFHSGWVEAAKRHMGGQAKVIGTNDLGHGLVTAGLHATHMLIEREYVDGLGSSWDGPGVVCHEGYRHCYVDDEIVHAAKARNVWVSATGSVVEHMHPGWGKSSHDDVYAIGGMSMPDDSQLFAQRRTYYLG